MLRFLFENLWMGLKNLRLHKLRTLLTAMGIIIGVAAVIIMVAIGEGNKREAMKQMEQLGATNIVLRSVPPPQTSSTAGANNRAFSYGLTEQDLERLRTVPGQVMAVPLRMTEQRVSNNGVRYNSIDAVATTPQFFQIFNLRCSAGQVFTELQNRRREAVCVLGAEAARLMFPTSDPLGQTVLIGTPTRGTTVVTVVGVLRATGLRASGEQSGIMQWDMDLNLYFPTTHSQDVFHNVVVVQKPGSVERKVIEISEVWIKADSMADVEPVSAILANSVGLPKRNDVTAKAPLEILRAAERQARMFNLIMVSIAAFSLVVGGIGIMNIMLATVTERTKEIGIRRALGAKRKHITLQFLIETTAIALVGGLLGIAFGMGGAKALTWLVETYGSGGYPTAIAPWSVVGSFVISGVLGVGFGLYPAITAARMNPIEALRHE